MPDDATCYLCAAWDRLPYGSGGYKAGTCADRHGAQTLAPESCAAWRLRPVSWAAWGLGAPAPRPEPMTANQARGAVQPGLFA